jgi:hypothetical protein
LFDLLNKLVALGGLPLKASPEGALKNKPAQARGDFWAGLFFNIFKKTKDLRTMLKSHF